MHLAIRNRNIDQWTTYHDVPDEDLAELAEWNLYDDSGNSLQIDLYTWESEPPEPVRVARASGDL